jgi:hypothetical protein
MSAEFLGTEVMVLVDLILPMPFYIRKNELNAT